MMRMTTRSGTESGGPAGPRRLLCYYGDDFTGSTDVLEALFLGGFRTVLFLEAPTPELLDEGRFRDVECFGVAGVGRSLTPEEMERELPPIFRMLRSANAAVVHYKVCSTFDSSPGVGSIGKAAEIGREVFGGGRFMPVVAGVPYLGRYTVFGNHFAVADGEAYRLDRHPTMSRHPVTPMAEADLRRHLAGQTSLSVGLLDVLEQSGCMEEVRERFEALLSRERPDLVLMDVLDNERLKKVGRLIWEEAERGEGALFAIGSSGVEYALSAVMAEAAAAGRAPTAEGESAGRMRSAANVGYAPASSAEPYAAAAKPAPVAKSVRAAGPSPAARSASPVERLLVVSGSCSPVTERQIARALEAGYAGIRVPAAELVHPERREGASLRMRDEALSALAAGRSVLLYSALGPGDDTIRSARAELGALGLRTEDSSRLLGSALGFLARELIMAVGLKRLLIAGGDTSGYVTRELGVYALECKAALVPGAPLCGAYSTEPALDGLELVLKGGQIGGPDFFEQVRLGR